MCVKSRDAGKELLLDGEYPRPQVKLYSMQRRIERGTTVTQITPGACALWGALTGEDHIDEQWRIASHLPQGDSAIRSAAGAMSTRA